MKEFLKKEFDLWNCRTLCDMIPSHNYDPMIVNILSEHDRLVEEAVQAERSDILDAIDDLLDDITDVWSADIPDGRIVLTKLERKIRNRGEG